MSAMAIHPHLQDFEVGVGGAESLAAKARTSLPRVAISLLHSLL
jgi:hypothetical protein